MTLKKTDFEKEIYNALQTTFEGCYYSVEVIGYSMDDCYQSNIEVSVNLFVNGGIDDLPSGYKKDDPESDYIMSLLASKKKMDWKEFVKVRNELEQKGYCIDWKAYHKGKTVNSRIAWKVAPCKFTFQIVRVNRFD